MQQLRKLFDVQLTHAFWNLMFVWSGTQNVHGAELSGPGMEIYVIIATLQIVMRDESYWRTWRSGPETTKQVKP